MEPVLPAAELPAPTVAQVLLLLEALRPLLPLSLHRPATRHCAWHPLFESDDPDPSPPPS